MRPRTRASLATLVLWLSFPAGRESPFSPPPTEPTCGTLDCPCALTCADGDCRNLPLVELRALWQKTTLDVQLASGETITPLFSCRQTE